MDPGGSGGGFGGGTGGGQVGGGDGGDPTGAFPNWKGEYFKTIDLTGAPALVRDDRYINFNWGENRVIDGMPKDYWSARWTRSGYYPQGTYRFTVDSDDGSRIFVNNRLIMDNWDSPSLTPVSVDYYHPGGQANIRVDYYDRLVNARMIMNVAQISSGGSGSGGSGGGFGGGSSSGRLRWIRRRVWRRYKPDHPAVPRRTLPDRPQCRGHLFVQPECAPCADNRQ